MGVCGTKSKQKQQEFNDIQGGNNEQNTHQQPDKQNIEEMNQIEKSGGQFLVDANIFISLKNKPITSVYKIKQVLGEGAYGKVSLVVHKTTDLVRAMKQIQKSAMKKDEAEKMFGEVNILKNLDHHNIVKLYELFQDEKHYYLITEYCKGGELFDKIKALRSFSEKMAATYMQQILSAIVYCHERKIVHRDLKPENLLFDSKKDNAIIKVIDFGTSRKFISGSKMTERLGTPYYIAPEVLEGKYDEKCDVWSCGIILYIFLCGYPPFAGHDDSEILKKVRKGKFEFDEEDWLDISQDAKNLITKMLYLDPKKRITAQQAINDPWIQKNAKATDLSVKVLKNMTKFQSTNKLRSIIITFIVTQMSTKDEINELTNTFKALDKDNNGTLTKEELVEGYLKVFQTKEEAETEANKIIEQVDQNRTGLIDYTEFLSAAFNNEKLLSKTKIEQAFQMFDINQDGYISRNELQEIMGGIVLDDKTWIEFISQNDNNSDGKISLSEFIAILMDKVK